MSTSGFLIVDKPQNLSSHDVVQKVRKLFPDQKVGHGGTLDPLATGVLVLGIGKGTKHLQKCLNDDKEYYAECSLGVTTDTQDSTGKILKNVNDFHVSKEDVERNLTDFQGDIYQMPPMFSAKKVKGKRLYELARKGVEVEREKRKIHIYELTLIFFDGEKIAMNIRCSKGTYVRTLCHDLGEKIGVGAHMSSLKRTRSGSFSLDEAFDLDHLQSLSLEQRSQSLIPVDKNKSL
ncbi:tRNA pseudouridine(55) synthase TruB [PVC group bacterium (ex Bugula neritina AB1)]|nr:tRNA pseudouridine(55) synthase TruB [PVC group bacterium (ex Bugula neritina AB1)]